VRGFLSTLAVPQIVVSLLQILCGHLTATEEFSVEWHRSFPLDFLLTILSQFSVICSDASVSRADLLRTWLLCLAASVEFSHTVADSDRILRDLWPVVIDIQIDTQSCVTFLEVLHEMCARQTMNISTFNYHGYPAFILAMSMYEEQRDIQATALCLMGLLIKMGAFLIPVHLGDFLQTAANTRLKDDGICRQSLLNAALFLRRDPTLASQLSSEVGQLIAWSEQSSFMQKHAIALFLSEYVEALCDIQEEQNVPMEILAELLVGFGSELAVLSAFARFFAVVCERRGEDQGMAALSALAERYPVRESLDGLLESDDEMVRALATVLLDLLPE
jgi:hypothetical protein